MKMQWKRLWLKGIIWLAIEIILNLLGLDSLADYSEFLFEKEIAIASHPPQVAVLVPPNRPQFHNSLSHGFIVAFNG